MSLGSWGDTLSVHIVFVMNGVGGWGALSTGIFLDPMETLHFSGGQTDVEAQKEVSVS